MSGNAFNKQSTITSVSFGKDCSYVGKRAFESCTSLMTINIDNVIETIGEMAFSNTNLKSVTFNKLTELGSSAFKECKNLNSISIPNCYKIPNSAFSSCEKLNNIDLYNCIEIGNNAFQGCVGLNTLELNECKTIGELAFNDCKNISEVTLNACESIGTDAFLNCPNLTKVYINDISDSGDSDSDDVEICKLSNPEAFFINVSETDTPKYEINPNLFFYVKPNVIDKYKADTNWESYKSQMVSAVDYNQILYTYSVEGDIELPAITTTYKDAIEKHTYDKESKTGFIQFKERITALHKIFEDPTHITSIDIPSECESIEDYAFEGYTNLTNIKFSNTLTRIGEYAFKNCKSFTSFKIPQTVTELGEGIFAGCENMENFEGKFTTYNNKAIVYDRKLIAVVPIDNGVLGGSIYDTYAINSNISYLGKSCFSGCKKLRRININANIISIGDNAFEGCENLRDVHLYNNGLRIQNIDGNVFGETEKIRSDFKIFVPEASFQKYNNNMQYYTDYIYPIPNNAYDIIYYNTSNLGGVLVNNGYKNGTYYKFTTNSGIFPIKFKNTSVEKIILGEGYTRIYDEALKNCKKLNYIYIPDHIQHFGLQCFYGCESLTSINIPSGIKNITSYVNNVNPVTTFNKDIFYGCTKLKEFGTYIKGLTIDDRCYIQGNTLKFFAQGSLPDNGGNYTIPDGIKTIGAYTFNGCSKLTSIDLNEVISINDSAFKNCGLTSVDISKITTINKGVFNGCSNLKEVTGTENLTSINENAFKDCINLTNIKLPDTLTYIGKSAFENCKEYVGNTTDRSGENKILQIPMNMSSMGESCFKNSGIKSLYITDTIITNVPNYAFSDCVNLKKIVIESNIIDFIGKGAFENCINLCESNNSNNGELILNDFIKVIKDNAFKGCNKITKVILPTNLSKLGNLCFATGGDSKLTIRIPDDAKSAIEFTLNDTLTNTKSYPFGNPEEYTTESIYITMSIDYFNKYRTTLNEYWSNKYGSYMFIKQPKP